MVKMFWWERFEISSRPAPRVIHRVAQSESQKSRTSWNFTHRSSKPLQLEESLCWISNRKSSCGFTTDSSWDLLRQLIWRPWVKSQRTPVSGEHPPSIWKRLGTCRYITIPKNKKANFGFYPQPFDCIDPRQQCALRSIISNDATCQP